MNKKGFTLTELLGIIVILGLIMLIVTPAILNRLSSKKEEINEIQTQMLKDAANMYFENNPDNNGCVSIDTLKNEGYLNKDYKEVTNETNNIQGINKSGDSCTP